MAASKPIVIVKKKGGHGGHHGGAWKVAYADFVTAMMSLFIVLWLMNTSEKVRQAVAGYFNDPRGKSTQTGTDQSGSSENLALDQSNIADLKKKIEEAVRRMNDLKALENQIQITITPEGLRIELLETKDGTFFDTGSATLNQNGRELLEMLAGQLGGLPNRISIEGHTDSAPYASKDGYGNWDLSSDRANAARRVMQASGLRENQVSQVRGYADQKLRVPSNPLDPSNRRISVIVQYLSADQPPVPASSANGPGAHGAGGITSGREQPANPGPTVSIPAPGNRAASGGNSSNSENPAAPPKAGIPVQLPSPTAENSARKQKLSAAKVAAGSIMARLWSTVHKK